VPLSVGDKLGPFEILAPIGAGGMGEVYRARDTKLDRDVAIKVLPHLLANDPERLARFEREAKVLAALNHPNIAQIYGLEQRALVMELVEGETLKGPLPIETTLNYARQIADALEAAHEKGITHRDLKPANIMVTPAGVVKVLDFGLAAVTQDPASGSTDPSNSPTLTMRATQAGMIVGTAAYMSPEQASGKPVDKRADIWSFGVVLWEMLTGRRLFEGETISHTLADVLRGPIDFEKLPKETPRAIRDLLRRCLDRDVKNRLRDIGEARVAIANVEKQPEATAAAVPVPQRRILPWAAAALMTLVAAGVSGYFLTRPAPLPLVSQFSVVAPPDTAFTNTFAATAVSPDGRYLVFGARRGSTTPSLWLRPLDSLAARPLPGTEGGNFPFWSPDSKSIAFFADGKLKRVEPAGGAPLVLCDHEEDVAASVGGTWNRDGIILFGGTDGLRRVPASGGQPVPLTTTDVSRQEAGHGYPQFLPDGKHFLYFIQSGSPSTQGVYAGSLDRPQDRIQVVRTAVKAIYTQPVASYSGYLLWLREQTLLAQRFDLGKLLLEGDPAPVAEDIAVNAPQRAAFWTSDAGLLVYRNGGAGSQKLVWMSRDGKRTEQGGMDIYNSLRLSPDGRRVAFGRGLATANIWLLEFARSVLTRLTFGTKADINPVWSPDGRQIAFSSNRSGVFQIYRKDAGGGGQEEQLTSGPNDKYVTDWRRDGKYLLYTQADPKTSLDLWALPLDGDRKPAPVLQSPFLESGGQFSADGRWIVYNSTESGRTEVYIRAFPTSAGKWQISNRGGAIPRWRADGKELFYVSPDFKMMAVTIRASAAGVEADTPRELFTALVAGVISPYDVAADGQRFLLMELPQAQGGAAPLTVVLNWQAGLK
jgi:Tol biopolymer transport system component/predicted Ser/Thr protein kinase